MSAAFAVLPQVWAFAVELPEPRTKRPDWSVRNELSLHRRYTEGLLRRYVRMSMEAGKVPSLLGKEMFRGKVTSYRVESFEDVVIFLHDVERCLERLEPEERTLIARIAIHEYTVEETAAFLHCNQRTVIRRYGRAIDRLTEVLLRAKMIERQKCCQGA